MSNSDSLIDRLLDLSGDVRREEDFFTEAFATLCRHAPDLFFAWLEDIGAIPRPVEYTLESLTTQVVFTRNEEQKKGDRPDLMARISGPAGETVVLIESKIASTEGDHQATRYARLLQHRISAGRKALVYVTRNYEVPDLSEIPSNAPDVHVIITRWHTFYSLLVNQKHNPQFASIEALATEIQRFMENHSMGSTNKFTASNAVCFKHIRSTLDFMTEALTAVAGSFFEIFPPVPRTPGVHIFHITAGVWNLMKGVSNEIEIRLGFFPDEMDEYPQVGFIIGYRSSWRLSDRVYQALNALSPDRKAHYVDNSWFSYMESQSMKAFLSEPDHMVATTDYLNQCIARILEIVENNPDLPWPGDKGKFAA